MIVNKNKLVLKFDDGKKCINLLNHLNIYYSIVPNLYNIECFIDNNIMKNEYYINIFYNEDVKDISLIRNSILAILN